MFVSKKIISRNIKWVILLILTHSSVVRLYPTSCAEDSQCPSGFFCEEDAHYCRECIHCSELKRESPSSQDDCVKSIVDCGACGLVQQSDGLSDGQCVPPGVRNRGPAGLLPPYAWAAITVSLLLVVLIICVFFKMNTYKILFSSHTSVQQSRASAPPPPYNDVQLVPPHSLPELSLPPEDDAFESSKLMELSHPSTSPESLSGPLSFRENSDNQAARVYNLPIYARLPQSISRCDTPEIPVSVSDENDSRNMNIVSLDAQRDAEATLDGNNHFNSNENKCEGNNSAKALLRKNSEVEDTNNNYSEEPASSQRPSGTGQYCSNVLAGPSFVINVVENINTIQHKTTKIT